MTKQLYKLLTSVALLTPMAQVALSGDCLPQDHEKCRTDYSMPSASMNPTLVVGDNFFVDKQSFDTHLPDRGDVVVFIGPKNSEITYVKRIVGLPGDRIQMRDGVLFINGHTVSKERIQDYVANTPKDAGGGYPIEHYEETLPNGVKYRVLEHVNNSIQDSTIEYLVPANHYFLMGDNRDNSEDSRFLDTVGYVPRENIIGSATSIYFSWTLSRIGLKIE